MARTERGLLYIRKKASWSRAWASSLKGVDVDIFSSYAINPIKLGFQIIVWMASFD